MYSIANRFIIHRLVSIFGIIILSGFTSPNVLAMADVALGGHNICSIDTDGRLECTSRFNASTYIPPDDGTLYKAVSSGGAHTCAITQAGEIRCWGLNNFGQSNNVPTSSVAFTTISAAENHTCAIDANRQVYCWGLNTNGQTNVPTNNQGFSTLFTGALGTCGGRTSGDAECWSNDFSYVSRYDTTSEWIDMVFPAEGSDVPACSLTNEGFIDCWSFSSLLPKPENGPYTQIDASGFFFCGLKTDGDLDCSVYNFRDDFDTNATNQTVLAAIEALPPLVDFEVRSSGPSLHGLCGIDFDGQLHCVGNGLSADNLPGEQVDITGPSELSFSVYSDTAGELFWLFNASSIGTPVVGFNVYRNDEFLLFTEANASYFDEDLQPNTSYKYEVATVLLGGAEGQRSEAVTVSAGGDDEPPENPEPDNTLNYVLSGMELKRYSGLTLELFWDRPIGNETVSRFDVFRNGEYLTTTPGPSFYDNTVQYCGTYEYTIAAVSTQGRIVALGFQSVGTFPGTTCP